MDLTLCLTTTVHMVNAPNCVTIIAILRQSIEWPKNDIDFYKTRGQFLKKILSAQMDLSSLITLATIVFFLLNTTSALNIFPETGS